MPKPINKFRRLRKYFIGLFLLSVLLFTYNYSLLTSETTLMMIASLVTATIGVLGFIITTILNFRKERRDLKTFELDNEKKDLEIRKLKLDLQQAKEQSADIITTPKKKKAKH